MIISRETIRIILQCFFYIKTFLPSQIVQKPSHEKKQMLTPQSKVVADKVAKLVHSAEALKGKKKKASVFTADTIEECCSVKFPIDIIYNSNESCILVRYIPRLYL